MLFFDWLILFVGGDKRWFHLISASCLNMHGMFGWTAKCTVRILSCSLLWNVLRSKKLFCDWDTSVCPLDAVVQWYLIRQIWDLPRNLFLTKQTILFLDSICCVHFLFFFFLICYSDLFGMWFWELRLFTRLSS